MAHTVLKKFSVDENADVMVEIHGRNGGALAWLLNVMGMDDTAKLLCTKDYIEYQNNSLFGSTAMMIPLAAVSGLATGIRKPKEWLIAAGVVFAGGCSLAVSAESVIPAGLGLLLGLALAFYYTLQKEMSLNVQNGGDSLYGLNFKKSIIEGVSIDPDKLRETVRVMNQAILSKNG